MLQSLAAVTVLVPSYDDGLAFFRDVLGFAVLEDTPLSPDEALGCRRPVAGRRRGAGARGSERRASEGPCWRPDRRTGRLFPSLRGLLGGLREAASSAASISWKRRAASPMGSLRSLSIPGAENGICCSRPAELPKRHEVRPVSLERQVLFWGLGLAALLLDCLFARLDDNAVRRRHRSRLSS